MHTDIKAYLEMKKPIIDAAIEKYLPRKINQKHLEEIFGKPSYIYDIPTIQKSLIDPVWDFLDRGGKRWRPALFLLISEIFGAKEEHVLDFSILPELAHNGSIIIDDIEDSGELRRGKPCIHITYGIDIALNAGNFLYFLPLAVFRRAKIHFNNDILTRAYEVYGQEMTNIHLGQTMDIYWHKGHADSITEDQYLQMCAYKTGCLTRMAARLAAVLSDADKDQVERLGRFAEMIGIAFQIQDDILSASGSEFQDKKGYGDDITEGKRTLMVIHAIKHADEKERKRLLEILDMHTRDKRLIKEAIDILQRTGSVDYAMKKARELVENAWKEADAALPESDAKQKLKGLADFLIERKI